MRFLIALSVAILAPGAAVAAADAPARPNIVLILADDLGYGDLACYGHLKFKTPNLDRLAAEGARLTHFNCPAAFCAPTRASLMTGRYPFRCGMTQNPTPDAGPVADALHLPEHEVTLAQLLRQAGYATGMVGKWHLGHAKPEWLPTRRGFDEYLGIPYSNDMRPVQLLAGTERCEYPVVQATLTRRYTAHALDFVERSHRQARPFFLYVAQMLVHKPLAVSEECYKRSGEGLYGDAIRELDWSIGELLAKLKALGIEEQTLVLFTSDNGPWFGGSTGGLRGMKGSTYEGGYRVPCLARWPGKVPAGHVSSQPAVMMDLFVTALKVAQVEPPAGLTLDGRDIMPLFCSDAKSPHVAILGAQGQKLATVRDERWKLHVLAPNDPFLKLGKGDQRWIDPRGPDGVTIFAPYEQYQPDDYPGLRTGDAPAPMQLFDLQADPREQHDVAAQHPDVVASLKQAFDDMNAQPRPHPEQSPEREKSKEELSR
jgi:uncharacterized sulfatase